MQQTFRVSQRGPRLIVVFLAIVFFALLIIINASHTFFHAPSNSTIESWLFFGLSTLTALSFLVVGTLVWLYGRNRPVAILLFAFCCTMMTIFASETNSADDTFLLLLAGSGGVLSIPLLNALLLIFPTDFLSLKNYAANTRTPPSQRTQLSPWVLILRLYIITLTTIDIFTAFIGIPFYFPTRHFPSWLDSLITFTQAIGLISIVIIIIISYRYSPSQRERQQMRLFVGGTIVTIIPFLVLTIVPEVIGGLNSNIIDPRFSTIPLILFPIVLGYSFLRYQILVVDVHIRRAVTWIAGIIGLSVFIFLTVAISSIIFDTKTSIYVISVATLAASIAPIIWWITKIASERIFFSEILYYQRLINQPTLLNDVTLDLAEAAQLITFATSQAFGTEETCLFVLDEDSGHFRICPPLNHNGQDEGRLRLLHHVLAPLDTTTLKVKQQQSLLELSSRIVQQVANTQRPLLWQELMYRGETGPAGFTRYLNIVSQQNMVDAVFAPVRAQGKMIGILVAGERSDHQPYGGPDFEILQLIFSRFSPILESARLYTRASRHAALLNNLYHASAIAGNVFQNIKDVATAYTRVAAEAISAHAEIWLYDRSPNALWFVPTSPGQTSHLTREDCLQLVHARDWQPWFFEGSSQGESAAQTPPCLRQTPQFPFAWLPLQKDKEHLGMLVLIYAPPHTFLKEERNVLQMFAGQCTTAIENTRMTIELRAAYERQKELDQLKDQFIVTASHELRTPLTAVQGYIELLREYDENLPAETRAEFITRAGRSCDELTLMVENIMDASRLQIDAENIRPNLIPLTQSVMHILEILDGMMRRENRVVTLTILPDTMVVADEKRLRQVILNLLSNALKYSPAGSPVEISARTLVEERHVVVRIRDYGAGITPADQQRLFERFVRLERDVNSSVRGAGLGLYICKQLIEAMGGRIWVESSGTPGRGSTFSFTLPTVYPASPQQKHYRLSQTAQFERVKS